MDGDIRPDIPRNIDAKYCVMTGQAPITAAMQGDNGRGRWAGQTQQILTETCTIMIHTSSIVRKLSRCNSYCIII